MRCYATQFPKAKEFIFERIRAAAMHDGIAAGYEAGELFASPRTLGTRDLVHFLFGQTAGRRAAQAGNSLASSRTNPFGSPDGKRSIASVAV